MAGKEVTMPPTAQHDYDPAACSKLPRHHHDYRTPPGVSPRCPVGHRGFRIRVGGPLPPLVACTTCSASNRTATAYEAGRLAACGA